MSLTESAWVTETRLIPVDQYVSFINGMRQFIQTQCIIIENCKTLLDLSTQQILFHEKNEVPAVNCAALFIN
jgi:hypothetical protein